MLKHGWTVISNKSVVDKETNNLSIYDVFEQLEIKGSLKPGAERPKEINIPIQFEVISFWVKDDPEALFEGKYFVEVESPKGKIEKTMENDLVIPTHNRRMRTILRVQGLTVQEPGYYLFNIYYQHQDSKKRIKVASVPLEIIIQIES